MSSLPSRQWESTVCLTESSAPAGGTARRHDCCALIYVESGSAVYRVGEREVVVRQGDLLAIGKDQDHRIQEYLSPSIKIVELYFHAAMFLGPESAEYLIPFDIRNEAFPPVIPAGTGIPVQVLALFNRVHLQKLSGGKHAELATKTYLKMILILLIDHYAEQQGSSRRNGRKRRDQERLQPLFDYIEGHLMETIPIELAAGLLHMSQSHFMRFFRSVTGSTFVSYLNRLRVYRAQQLMAETNQSIASISQEVGFCDQSYFGVLFRRVVGTSPRDYRNRLRAA